MDSFKKRDYSMQVAQYLCKAKMWGAINLFCVVANVLLVNGQSSTSLSSSLTFNQSEVLDESSGLSLEWNVNLESQTILFKISTSIEAAYVALGLTKKGRVVQGDDVVVVGIGNDEGGAYVIDMAALNERTVVRDGIQDWELINTQILDSGGVSITIQRRLETCDEQDYIFNSDLIHVVWAQGPSEISSASQQFDITFVNASRQIYFLDPIVELSPSEAETIQTFRISRRFQVPPRHTSYWCTLHKVNVSFSSKNQIVGFAPYFDTDLAREHVHHQIVYRCTPPPGTSSESFFEQFVSHPGEECYLHDEATFPYNFCREPINEWAVMGKSTLFPNTVGFPVGDTGSSVEYFFYETHYNNPEIRDDLVLNTGVDFQYTSQLRENDGGILLLGYGVLGNWVMPPLTSEFDVAGHCNPFCTARMFPLEGVEVLGIRLHAHLSSRRIRVKHFRGGRELPWIQNDDNYDFNFQQWRWFPYPIKMLPGDQITVQCGYDNHWKNDSSATVSGFSTRDEMCHAWLLLDKRIPYQYCSSEYPTENTLDRFGIQNMTWELTPHDRVIYSATDPQNVGLTLTQMMTNVMSNWTTEEKLALENEQLYSEHAVSCPNRRVGAVSLYAFDLLQQNLPGGIQFPLPTYIEETRLSVRTISTPLRNSKAIYPRVNPEYSPPSSCPRLTSGAQQTTQIPPVDRSALTRLGQSFRSLRFPFRRS